MATEVISSAAVELDLTGDIEQSIDRLIGQFDTLGRAVERATNQANRAGGAQLDTLGARFDNMASGVRGAMHAAGVFAVAEIAQMVSRGGEMIQNFGSNILGTFGGVAGEILQQAAQFEGAQASFARVFGERGPEMLRQAGQVAQRTSFLTSQVNQLAVLIGRAGADPFQNVAATITDPQTGRQTQGMITALEALNDLAATRPGSDSMPRLMVSLQNFLGGTTARSAVRSLRQVFDLPIEAARDFETAFESNETTAGRFAAFVEVAGRRFGGMGQSMSNTTNFIMSQFEDIKELLFNEIGRPALDVFKPLLIDVQDFLNTLLTAEQEGGGLTAVFTELAEAVAAVARPMLEIAKAVIRFAVEHPTLLKWAIIFTLLVGIITFVAGTVIVGLISALTALLVILVAVTLAISAITPLLLPMIAALLVLAPIVLAGIALWQVYEHNLFGIRDTVERVTAVVRALWQALTSLNDAGQGVVDQETFGELERLGLTDVVLQLGGAFFRLKEAAEAAWEGISRGLSTAWQRIRPILLRIFGFGDGNATGGEKAAEAQAGVSGLIETINSISPDEWERFGAQIGLIIEGFLTAVETIQTIVAIIVLTARILRIVFAPLIAMFQIFMALLSGIWNLIQRIVAVPLFQQALEALTGINLGGPGGTVVPQKTGVSADTRERVQAARQEQRAGELRTGQQGVVESLARFLGAPAATQGHRKQTVVQVQIDGRQIAEATAEANDDENVRLGVES